MSMPENRCAFQLDKIPYLILMANFYSGGIEPNESLKKNLMK